MLQVYITYDMHLKYSKIFYVMIAYSKLQLYKVVSPWRSVNSFSGQSFSLGNLTTILGKLRNVVITFFLQLLGAPPKGRATIN